MDVQQKKLYILVHQILKMLNIIYKHIILEKKNQIHNHLTLNKVVQLQEKQVKHYFIYIDRLFHLYLLILRQNLFESCWSQHKKNPS